MRHHKLKTLPTYFERVQLGQKTFEIRKNDRDFQVGDILELEYYNPDEPICVGYNYINLSIIKAEVKYILNGGKFGLDAEYCIMAIEILNQNK
jgi:hypothetical protein